MNKKVFIFLILVFQIPFLGFADSTIIEKENQFLNQYYQNLFIGEKKTGNYLGPLDPRSRFNDENGQLQLLDDQFSEQYLTNQIQTDAFDLHNFWFKKIISKSTCPDIDLGENIDYIRYLYRLVSISYLYESLKINHKISSQLGAERNICSLSFGEVFGKCQPQTDDMKKFHERVYGKFSNQNPNLNFNSFTKLEMSKWIDNFQHSTTLSIDPVNVRLHDWCRENSINCRTISVDNVKKALGSICIEDRNLIQTICSEKDNLYGISYAGKASELIQTSNAFNLINRSGMGEDCLQRFVKIFTPKEVSYNVLERQFPLIFSQLVRDNSRYLQGELFLPGALKEFDILGLSDFLTALKPPKAAPPVVMKLKPKPKPAVIAVSAPIEVPKTSPSEVVVITPTKPTLSEFENAVFELDDKKLESLSIDMDSFRDSFEFTQQSVTDLSSAFNSFKTLTSLKQMKAFDHLGSTDAPVGLLFLKFLIDTDNHQGLYNIITVLGDKFYVVNDLEAKNRPVYIELRNDASTKNQWQIILIQKKPQKYSEALKN